ncbi:54S ribosomal protein L28, mitochondrial [Neolecta irregularis DAH-3]|uniref:Large ribosomal subunit protein mL40 n=1 Tax=Neolecta irregularis (strain DAH-3) TaxID=1198029 RepID=A0A1U7LIY1_NEOID|nr:54S ribosomal protein L28, mitochondrial [Neolecta irregularis DAH-3]|eukprot:OLL22481.1 54S ribosomal protein L28, mitochondrial [Neolecta irregularis DAH-3]
MPIRPLLSFPSLLHSRSSIPPGLPYLVRNKTSGGPPQTGPIRKKNENKDDPRRTLLKRILYKAPNPKTLEMNEEDLIRHEVIHRAWHVRERNDRERRDAELDRQYTKIVDACTELEKADKKLFRASMMKPTNRLFPMEMRIPTDTPGSWKYDWKADESKVKSR